MKKRRFDFIFKGKIRRVGYDKWYVHSKHYEPTDEERKMIYRQVVTPNGIGKLLNVYEKAFEVVVNDEIDFYPKEDVSLSGFQSGLGEPFKPSKYYQDAWYQASMIEAANTPAKRSYINGTTNLNQYREHERKIYGTINA